MGLYPKQSDYRDYRFPSEHLYNRIYHVDKQHGDDTYSGLSWKKARQTIMSAVNSARYLPGTTTIDDTKDHRSLVLVAPNHYNEQVLFSGYGVEIVGCGHGRPGGDYGVVLNYDDAIAATCVIGFSGSGIALRNLFLKSNKAIPGIYIAGGDNNLIDNCVIESDGTMTYGIEAASLKGSVIQDVIIRGFATAGIHKDVASYAIEGGIYRCQLGGPNVGAGADGILIDGCVKDGTFVIRDNFIDVLNGGAGSIGIVSASTATLFVAHNFVRAHTTGYSHAGDGLMLNHESVGAGAGAGVYAIAAGDV